VARKRVNADLVGQDVDADIEAALCVGQEGRIEIGAGGAPFQRARVETSVALHTTDELEKGGCRR
jgi:hypothetical protein